MESKPLVSVIIPSYNFEKYIAKCIKSIINQTYKEIEIIVINDGSTDNTKTIIDELAKQDERIIPIHKHNEGVSVARNIGISKAKGKYLCFVDADDYVSNDFVEYMVGLAETSNSDFCISSECFTKKGEKQTQHISIQYLNSERATAYLLSPSLIVGSWNKLYNRDLIINNKLLFSSDLFYGEGLKFITQVAQVAQKVAITNRKIYYYRRNNYFSATSNFNIQKFYNGYKALEDIESSLILDSTLIRSMLMWHKCQFKMGTVIRIISANKKKENLQYYKDALKYVKHNTIKVLSVPGVSIYKKLLLIGCCISPSTMSKLDTYRRLRIANLSIE